MEEENMASNSLIGRRRRKPCCKQKFEQLICVEFEVVFCVEIERCEIVNVSCPG